MSQVKKAALAAAGGVAALRGNHGVVNMPTRAIAAVLLRAEGAVPHQELYTMADEYGLFNSRRHFKHCLKMMKQMHRVRVRCTGPEYPGASRRGFVVELTRRGDKVYKHYLGDEPPLPGLADALLEDGKNNEDTEEDDTIRIELK